MQPTFLRRRPMRHDYYGAKTVSCFFGTTRLDVGSRETKTRGGSKSVNSSPSHYGRIYSRAPIPCRLHPPLCSHFAHRSSSDSYTLITHFSHSLPIINDPKWLALQAKRPRQRPRPTLQANHPRPRPRPKPSRDPSSTSKT